MSCSHIHTVIIGHAVGIAPWVIGDDVAAHFVPRHRIGGGVAGIEHPIGRNHGARRELVVQNNAAIVRMVVGRKVGKPLVDLVEKPFSPAAGVAHPAIPFIQADSVNRLISLLENMESNPMTAEQIIELMDFVGRQYNYYVSAGIYLGIFERELDRIYQAA